MNVDDEPIIEPYESLVRFSEWRFEHFPDLHTVKALSQTCRRVIVKHTNQVYDSIPVHFSFKFYCEKVAPNFTLSIIDPL